MYKILVIGAVNSTNRIIQSLYKHNFNIVGIMGHEPLSIQKVSGWFNLKQTANNLKVNFKSFQKINDQENIIWAEGLNADIIFAVGFSQLLGDAWFNISRLGIIGFHPTVLPKGRGRAPLAWLILKEKEGAATFFLMGKGADDGPIFVQEKFAVDNEDDANLLGNKILTAIDRALDIWLPQLKAGIWNPIPQDELQASWYGKRNPEDGVIKWNESAEKINRLIKASSNPHPGAFTFSSYTKIIIWKSRIETELKIEGVVGRILLINKNKEFLIQTGCGLIWISDIQIEENNQIQFHIGQQLGLNSEIEIYKIWKELKRLKRNG